VVSHVDGGIGSYVAATVGRHGGNGEIPSRIIDRHALLAAATGIPEISLDNVLSAIDGIMIIGTGACAFAAGGATARLAGANKSQCE
jgi:hypothetical protein